MWNLAYQALGVYQLLIVIYSIAMLFSDLNQTPVGRLLKNVVEPFVEFFDEHVPPMMNVRYSTLLAWATVYMAREGLRFFAGLF